MELVYSIKLGLKKDKNLFLQVVSKQGIPWLMPYDISLIILYTTKHALRENPAGRCV